MIYMILIRIGIIRRYGRASVYVYDKDGQVKAIGEGYNMVVDAGKGELGDLMIGVVTNTLNVMNVGTSNQAASANDIDLISPASPVERLAITPGARFRTNLLLTCSLLIPSTKYTRPVTIREVGLYFSPTTNGKLFARAIITAVTLYSGDSARVDYEIQL
jgi:hypothetical protein